MWPPYLPHTSNKLLFCILAPVAEGLVAHLSTAVNLLLNSTCVSISMLLEIAEVDCTAVASTAKHFFK